MTEEKDTLEEARSALYSMLSGVSCTPMEKEFFIRGYFLGKYSKSLVNQQQTNDDCFTKDIFTDIV